jgi:hypothetical protein
MPKAVPSIPATDADATVPPVKALHPDHLAARVSEALALRLLSRYRDARDAVEHYGGDLSALPDTPSHAEIDERYWELLRDEVIDVRPDTASAELRYIDLIETIVADRLLPHDAPVMSNEQDLCCALQMLRSIHNRANAPTLTRASPRSARRRRWRHDRQTRTEPRP